MTQSLAQVRAALNGAARPALTGLIVTVGLGALLVLETKAARYAFHTAPQDDQMTPWLYAAVSIVCGVAAFGLSIVASMLKDDERKRVADRAIVVRLIALASLLVPIWSLAGAFAYDRQQREFETYQASPVYVADQAILADPNSTLQERRNARARMEAPGVADRGLLDVAGAAFLHLLVMQWAGAARLPKAVTEKERRAMRKAKKKTGNVIPLLNNASAK